jgi:hypothetical protein
VRVWQGVLYIPGPTTRDVDGTKTGKEVQVRVSVKKDGAEPVVDVAEGVDGVGAVRWRLGRASEFDPASMLRALALTSPEAEPAK